MDRSGADFKGVVDNLVADLEPRAAAIQYPIYEGRTWKGVYDLVAEEPCFLDERNSGSAFENFRLDPEIRAFRERLIEKIAEGDEEIFARYAQDEEIPRVLLQDALARAVKAGRVIPVLCGSAFADSTIAILLDQIVSLLPSPAEAAIPQNLQGEDPEAQNLQPDDSRLSAFVFKTLGDGSGDVVAWTRIWTGTLRSGKKCFDARSGKDVLVKNIFGILADQLINLESAGAGEVVALRASRLEPGASLCQRSQPVLFEILKTPESVVSQVIEPSSAQEMAAMRKALDTLAVEDGSLEVREERETGRFILSGQGELHLDIVAERLKRDYGISVRVGNPRINCKERPLAKACVRERFDRDFGGERVRTEVEVQLEPRADGEPLLRVAETVRVPAAYLAAARRGLAAAAASGPLEGWPLEGVGILVADIIPPSSGTGKNGELAVEAATALATRKTLQSARCVLSEPVMRLDIECPEESFGATLALVNSRGGRIESVEDRMSIKAVAVKIPMRALFGFSGDLRSATGGRGQYQARFEAYEIMGQAIEA
jgi:elongation factor G